MFAVNISLITHYQFRITVQLNVNHTVDSSEPDDGSEEAPEMKSRPNFEVDIEKGGKTLSFTCSYIHVHDGPEQEAKEQGFGEYINRHHFLNYIYKVAEGNK